MLVHSASKDWVCYLSGLVWAAVFLLGPGDPAWAQGVGRSTGIGGAGSLGNTGLGGSTGSLNTSASGRFGSGTQLGAGGSFRPNSSTFGSALGLSLPGATADPFAAARVDPGQLGRAAGSTFPQIQPYASGSQFPGSTQAATTRLPRVRSVTRIAFEPLVMESNVVAQLAGIPLRNESMGGNVAVEVREGVAILTGSVASQHAAQLSAAIVALEPGVRSVQNRLEVSGK